MYIFKNLNHSLFTYMAVSIILLISSSSLLQAKVKIMPLGDSITWDWYYGDGRSDAYRSGYRNYLWYKLQDENYDVDFVGSRSNGSAVQPSYDGDNQGYTGWTCHQIASNVYSYLNTNPADVVLLHIGTNDSAYYSTALAVANLENILDEIDRFENDKGVKVIVILAKIINLQKNPAWINSFNTQLTAMAQQRITNGDEIVLVDMQSAVGWNLIDGIHPTPTGYQLMANKWFDALKPILDGFKNDNYGWLIPITTSILNE